MLGGLPVREVIDTIGFPITSCIALFWFIRTTMQKHNILLEELNRNIILNTESINRLINNLRGDK